MTLYVKQANGRYRVAESEEITGYASTLIESKLRESDALCTPDLMRGMLNLKMRKREYEVFACLFLDNRHRLIEYVEMFRGTIDGASVHPREVVKEALLRNAAAVVFAHNHPSGVAEPSQADMRITQRLKDALALIDVKVLDHFIVGEAAAVSFAERGIL